MESTSNKKLGLGIGVAVVTAVVVATVVLGKNSSNEVASTTPANTTANTSTNNNVSSGGGTSVRNDDDNSMGDENSENSSSQNTTQVTNTVVDTTKNSTSSLGYKNGSYTAVGSYMSPGGSDQLGVTLTVKNDIVTDVSIHMMPGDGTSSRFQQIFAANYKTYVVGQKLASLNLGKVSRSSLTPEGFNDAVAQIRAQAKA